MRPPAALPTGVALISGKHYASDSWGDPKHWILLDDPLEVTQWRPAVDRKEWAGAGCELEISAQDRGAITGEVLHQGHVLARAPLQNSMIVGAQVAHPVRLVAHHGHQVAVTLVGDDNDGKRDLAPGLAASNLDCGSLVGSDARCKGDAEQAA